MQMAASERQISAHESNRNCVLHNRCELKKEKHKKIKIKRRQPAAYTTPQNREPKAQRT